MPKTSKKQNNKNNKSNKTIFSEAFPPNNNGDRKKMSPFSDVHEILDEININKNEIIYKPLTKKNIEEVKNLHKEWFPIDYGDNWFNRIFENNDGYYFTIGAFYNLNSPEKSDNKEILIGLALCEWYYVNEYFISHTSPKVINEICDNINYKEEVKSYLKCDDYKIIYIMTIGVLDECRKLHIGSTLLDYIVEYGLKDELCVGVYLDVVSYNKSAIKFYEKNNFNNATTIKNYYNIGDKTYDAYVFVKVFSRQEKDDYRQKHDNLCFKFINKIVFGPFLFFIKIILFFLLFQCFRKKIKTE